MASVAYTTVEAKNTYLQRALNDANIEVMIITNATVSDATTYADLTEFSGTGYARETITAGSWTIGTVDGQATAADVVFTAGSGGWAGFYGYAIVSTEVSPEILSLVHNADGYTINETNTYTAEPTINL